MAAKSWGKRGKRGEYDYTGKAPGMFVVIEQFSILMVVVTEIYMW